MIWFFYNLFTFVGKKIYVIIIKNGKLFLIQKINIAGIFQNRRNITRNKVFFFSKSNNKRTFFTCGNQAVRIILAYNTKCVASFQLVNSLNDCTENVHGLLVIIIYKVSNDLCICLAAKNNSLCLEPAFELHIIFNNSIVNNCNGTTYVSLRMCIYITRLTVSGPSGMSNTKRTLYGFVGNFFFKKL